MIPALSTRNCTWPALAFLTAAATSGVTVPTFGVGHQTARDPGSDPGYRRRAWHRGGSDHHVEGHVAGLDHGGQVVGKPRRQHRQPWLLRPWRLGEHGDALVLLVPLGSTTAPRTTWSDFLASAELYGHVDGFIELGGGASLTMPRRRRGTAWCLSTFASRAFVFWSAWPCHTPSAVTPMERAELAMVRSGVQIGAFMSLHFGLGDLFQLSAG